MDRNPEGAQARIVIAGGGIAGMTLALAVKQALGEAFDVMLVDPAVAARPRIDNRAYAVAAAARNMLDALGVWKQVESAAAAMMEMQITDSRTPDVVRPVFLTFEGEAEPGQPFAHMVENGALVAALLQAAKAAGVTLRAEGVRSGDCGDGGPMQVVLTGGETVQAVLLVAADGAR
ncbi:MAG: FAD-dependent monooxygenase, partial [Bosea sp.]|nr:FAD-dependent monooxygenase [Bosea sp. (in: a-proteobacteria)]